MPSDAVAAFLEQARELRLLPDADLARLADHPDTPTDPAAVCSQLVGRGLLTGYQAERLLTGRGYTLAFAGFTLLDEPTPDAYRAIDPTTRTEVRLSRFTGTATPAAAAHPALLTPTASGTLGGEGFAVHRQPDGAHLGSLVADMGPMPCLLAAEYTRQAAVAVAAAHAAGAVHARLHPTTLFVGPLVQASRPKPDGSPRFRPGPTATVCVTDYGLPTALTPADDVFQLGGVLFHLLTGRQPGEVPLSTARPDCPAELVALAKGMLALNAADRPTMSEVVTRLTAAIAPNGQTDAVPLGKASNPEVQPANVTRAETEQVELVNDPPPLALAGGWAGHPAMAAPPPPAFVPQAWAPPALDEHPSAEEPVAPRRTRPAAAGSRQMLWLLAGAFVAINVLAVLVWALLILNPFAKK
jgi:hypothetical protein